MKSVFEEAIRSGNFDLPTMLERINYHHVHGNLTDGEREELMAMARAKATAAAGVDVAQKLLELDARVTALEKNSGSTGEDSVIPEYMPGKWYYQGDKVQFNGHIYTCTAPTGVVCTWSPDEYPAYWEKA